MSEEALTNHDELFVLPIERMVPLCGVKHFALKT